MNGQVASVLIVVALIAGAGIGYLEGTGNPPTVTQTFLHTTVITQVGGEECTVTEYHVWSVESIHNSTTIGGTSTQSYPVTTFETSGYPTYTTNTFTGTLTGAIAYWNATSCSLGNSQPYNSKVAFTSTVGSETFVTWSTTLNTCASCTSHGGGATFTFPLSITYGGGPWSLHYWVQNFTGTQNSISGNMLGSGNSSIWITFYVGGYAQYTLCASATKLANDSPQLYNLPLTLAGLNRNVTATGSNSTVESCGTLTV